MTTPNENVAQPNDFSSEELARYNRHIIIPNFGLKAQSRLKNARVLVIGAGGLGSPLLLYLAAAGVGTIGIIDFDRVEDSNLQRQVLYRVADIGKLKAEAAKKHLEELNPFINIEIHPTQLTVENALQIIANYDLVADGSDNFPTRYLVNDACVISGIPLVYASILQFEGQVSVFNYTNENGDLGPNYRDIYPTPPDFGTIPSCEEGGVLGVLPGMIGTMQANEVLKIITGIGEPLVGKLYLFNALSMESRFLKFGKDPQAKPISELTNYDLFCGVPTQNTKEMSSAELLNLKEKNTDFQLIDVRELEEFNANNIGATNIPLQQILERHSEVMRDKMVIVHCKLGSRSKQAIHQLERTFGFTNLYNLTGGIEAFSPQQLSILSAL